MFTTLSKQTFENLLGELDWVGGRSEMELHVGEKTLLAAHVGRRNQGQSSKKEERQIPEERKSGFLKGFLEEGGVEIKLTTNKRMKYCCDI